MDLKRTRRIAQELKKEISSIISIDLKDPRVSSLASLNDVELTNDLSQAKVFVSIIGSDQEKEETIEGLNSSKGFIKKELGQRLRLRHIPELIFVLDETIERGIYMDNLIDKVIKQDEENRKKYESEDI